jgi:hypothetical protein
MAAKGIFVQLGQFSHEFGPQRIKMDIANQLKKIGILLA